MKFLRSPAVHNLAVDPFALMRYGGKKKKQRFAYPYNRPCLEFFNKHCDTLIQKFALDKLHIRDSVISVHLTGSHIELTTEKGEKLKAKKIVFALGQSQKNNVPSWALKESPLVSHIFSKDFDWKHYNSNDSIAVVGAGITAIQSALYAMSLGCKISIIAPHALREHQFDSDPGWLGPKNMTKFSNEKSYDRRREWINSSRHVGSVPPDLFNRVRSLVHSSGLSYYESEVTSCVEDNEKLLLKLASNQKLKVDKVILATGFEKVRPGGVMIENLVKEHNLPVASCGFPVVDENLCWHPGVYVSGGLAELEIGPVAKNIAGARFAADRIMRAKFIS